MPKANLKLVEENDIDDDPTFDVSPTAKKRAKQRRDERLVLLIERIERLEEEKKGIADDIKDVYNEGKAVGYDAKLMRQIVRLRKMPRDDRLEMESILELYKAGVGLD